MNLNFDFERITNVLILMLCTLITYYIVVKFIIN